MSAPLKKIVNLKAKLTSDSTVHPGIIENLSEDGLYVRAVSRKTPSDFVLGKLLRVDFRANSGDKICLLGKVKWAYKMPPNGLIYSLGIEVINSNGFMEKLLQVL